MHLNFPLLIVFEGIDGSGKSTLCDLLYQYFIKESIPVLKNREPTDGFWGRQIRDLLQKEGEDAHKLLELFIKDREDDVSKNILPCLEAGKSIIMDRYYFSNAAYQGAMGISPELIINQNRNKKFPEPDRVYLIDLDPEIALKRVADRNSNSKNDFFEKADFLARVKRIYHEIADERFVFIDGSQSADESLEIIKKDIAENLCG